MQIRRRLRRSTPHCSDDVTTCLVGSGVGAGACIWKGFCSGICWLGRCRCKGGETRLVLIPCSCSRMASVRFKLVRAEMPCRGSIVATPDQSRNSSTHWVIPVASALAYIIYHTVASSRKGETISGWTRERGARDDRGTETLSVIGVFWGRWGCPGARSANKTYISAAGGISTSTGVSHSVCTTTVAGRKPRRLSLAKASKLPSWRGLRKRRGQELSAPEHTYVWLCVLKAQHEWWPLPQR